jgi:phosphate transport system substrate-binding protein
MDRNALARKSIVGWLASILLLVGLTAAQDAPSGAIDRTQDDSLEQLETLAYRPQELVSGPLRLAGSDTLQQAAVQWIAGFTAIHPEVQAELSSTNSEDGWAKLQKGECDVALMSRPVEAAELERLGKEGKQVVQLTVGIDRLVFIAHPSNPIREIPWNAEEGILGSQSSGGNWGRWLSGQSEWNDLPIALHGTQLGSGTRWHLERLLNGPSAFTGQIQEHASTSEVVEAVAGQEGALGLVSVSHGIGDQVRVVPLAWEIEQKLVDDPIPGSLRTPDCRPLFAVAIVESNDQELRWPPLHREFVEYLLSYSGQVDMVKDGFLPLTRGEIHAQREMAGLEIQR